ncbi:MerR family transcriptional regulator [Oleidesulfovibrio sp.]|uniref:MerR family transcriptional regulator n=1 Tax=Oleidesulfovibrio sp. TaxID=2909707 RepID=UPI003A899BCF
MTDRNLTHKELSSMLGVSETTIKSYRRKFPGCIPVASKGKPIRFTPEAGNVCVRIRDMFNLGMSVEEVRIRLAQEFDWIEECVPGEEEPAEKPQEPVVEVPARVELSQDLSASMSNLAKSMVALTQQQTTVLKRLQTIETMLGQLGLAGPVDLKPMEATLGPAWERRFERMQQAMEAIADSVTGLHQQVEKIKSAPAEQIESVLYSGETEHMGQEPVSEPDAEAMSAAEESERLHAAVHAAAVPKADPPRRILTLPLVFQSSRGEYLGVAGKARGRFSANDLKALLAMTFFPPERYNQQWEQDGAGWWMLLTQPESENPREFAIYMEETVTPRGNIVASVLRLAVNGTMEHPVELHNFISEMQGE